MQLGTIVGGDFRILEPLGKGGMGEVFVAEQLSTSKRRALKVMKPELVGDPTLRSRFEQEARVGARIQSEHVVEVVAAGIDAATGAPFIAMEMLEGEPLDRAVQRAGAMSPADVREIFAQLGHGLAAAHRAGVVHRDLKPENVFIASSSQHGQRYKVKILDFGISKLTAEAAHRTRMTSSLGTPRWMAPEQSGGQPITPATDVWALGLLVYWVMTGRYYWRHATGGPSDSVMTLMREVLFEPLVPASVRAHQQGVSHLLPPGFDVWFSRAVAREPSERFPEAGAAVAALDHLLTNATSLALTRVQGQGGAPGLEGGTTTGSGRVVWTSQPSDPFGQTVARSVRRPPKRFPAWAAWVVGGVLLLGLAGAAGVTVVVSRARERAAEEEERAERRAKKQRDEERRRRDEDEVDPEEELAPPVITPPHPISGDLSGPWSIVLGRNPNGSSYKGSATLTGLGGGAYQVRWSMGHAGFGLAHAGVFGVAFGGKDGASGRLLVCQVSGGVLVCRTASSDQTTTVLDWQLQGPGGLSGRYLIVRASDGASGSLTLRSEGQAVAASLSLGDGPLERGTGIVRANTLTVALSRQPQTIGTVVYDYSTTDLVGSWLPPMGTFVGHETLRRR